MTAARETYLPDHRHLEDSELLAPPALGPFTPLALFVCTYVAKLDNLHMDFVEMTRAMCQRPHGCLLAVNSNFGHAAQPGCERYLKAPKPPPERRTPARSRPRKVQGDGTCFNSAVEPVVAIDHPGLADGKVYFVKCFPTTGETQVPGVVLPDLADGPLVLAAFVGYLNELGVGDAEEPDADKGPEGGAPRRRAVTIASERPNMINYKFRLVRNSPRVLVNLVALSSYLTLLEYTKAVEGTPLTARQAQRFAGWPVVVLPPYPVRETKSPTDDVKVSFRFKEGSSSPRLNIFQEGKVNILGANSGAAAEKIYAFFASLFVENWQTLVSLQPRRDLERRQALRSARPPPEPAPSGSAPAQAPAELTDDEMEALLADVVVAAADVRAAQRRLGALVEQAVGPQVEPPPVADTDFRLLREVQAERLREREIRAAVDAIVADLDAEEWAFEQDSADDEGPLGEPAATEPPADLGGWGGRAIPVGRPEDVPEYAPGAWTFAERAGSEKCLYTYQEEGRRHYAYGPPARASQDPVLGEVDRQDVQDHEKDSLQDDPP